MKQGALAIFATTGLGLLAISGTSAGGPSRPSAVPVLRSEAQVTEGIVRAPVSELWRVFTTAEGFRKLGVAQCDIDFRIGGLIRSHYDPKGVLGDEATIQNEFLSFEPERMVSFRIQRPPKGFQFSEATWKGTWTVVTFTDLGEGRTQLRVTGMGYPDTAEGQKMREFFESGNAWVLRHLQQKFDATAPAQSAPAHAQSPLAPIAVERVIELPRSEVWKLLTTSEGWKRLFDVDSRIELRPGGKFEILFKPASPLDQQGSGGCTVLSLLPEQMVSFTWNAPPRFENGQRQRTWVVLHFDELAPTRTRLQIDHVGFAEQAAENPGDSADCKQVRAFFDKEWRKVLQAVKEQEAKR